MSKKEKLPGEKFGTLVVSSGHFHAFYIIFVALEYVLTIPPHSTHVIVKFSYFSKVERARNVLAPPFQQCRAV